MEKERIDTLVTKLGFATSREEAKRLVMAGKVFINTECIDKPGTKVPVDAKVTVKGGALPFVSRGGFKLERALQVFPVTVKDLVVIDVGASTGGFTDCALQHGAKLVYSVDVGYGQLAWKLRQDARVRVLERYNFRHANKVDFDPRPEVAVMDVSFISLTKLLPKLQEILVEGAPLLALVKPQFEAGPDKVGKGGIVRDPEVHRQVLRSVIAAARNIGFQVCGLAPSPIRGGDGNIEYLLWANSAAVHDHYEVTDELLDEQVQIAHHATSQAD